MNEAMEPRLLSVKQLTEYTGLSRNTAVKWADRAGARRQFGRRGMYDRETIDRELSNMPAGKGWKDPEPVKAG